jgi:RHS repeat-associated protein
MVSGLSSVVSYVYDDANRLASVNGVTYTWDNNGNLLNDGVNTYTYDAANRLKSIAGASTATFSYNGLGDRLSQNGVNYTLDLNTGLTQVLNDGTNTYLYGLDRVAEQQGGVNEYYLGDVLGSIRQIANNSGAITLARSYDPYGNTRQTIGDAQTNFGFTGEFIDPSGLIYLRARYYDSLTGRFATRDTWEGDVNRPISFNRWNYVQGNPINFTDPSGHDPWWCDGRYDEEICYAQWSIEHGGKLTAEFLKSTYLKFPDQVLKLLQQEFHINLPAGYQFRFALRSSSALPPPGNLFYKQYVYGVEFWFTELNGISGTLIEYSSLNQCAVFSLTSDIPSQATHLDYSVYITDEAFTHYDFHPDDVAGIMIHEAVHAWQESIVRDNLGLFMQAFSLDPRTSEQWNLLYANGKERQAWNTTLQVNKIGTINLSELFLREADQTKKMYAGGPDFPVDIPIYGTIIR